MRKLSMVLTCGLALLGFGASIPAVGSDQPAGSVEVAVLESNSRLTRIDYEIGEFSTQKVLIEGIWYNRILLGTEPNIMEKGMPDLPFVCRSIIIPAGAKMEVRVLESRFVERQMAVAPSRGLISRDLNPSDVPFVLPKEYNLDEFYPADLAELGSPYILRDFRGITVRVYPFQYNPRTQTLRVYTHLVLEVRNAGSDSENVKVRGLGRCDPYFSDIYRNHFLNFADYKYDAVSEQGRMIVISYGDFMNTAQMYADWKKQKGIPTDLFDVATVGTTPEAIREFIRAEYLSEQGLTFVQLVGDYEHIPSFLIDRDFCDGMATSDASYALLEGDDSYPEIFVGRFSAADVPDVRTQVLRTVWYERDIADGEWLHKATGLASAWGEGYGYLGMRDRDLMETLRIMLLGYAYTLVDQLYEWGDPPFNYTPVEIPDFMNTIDEGRGLLLVMGSGDCEASLVIPPGIPAPGEVFTTDSVYHLANDNMLPVVSIGAPYQGNFQIGLSFPEAWMRATNTATGAPIGAMAVYASSTDLDYASTQAAQYELVNLLVNDQMRTVGGLMYNGACYSIDLYGARGEKTFQSYHIFGDASLAVRTDAPGSMIVTHESVIDSGQTIFRVQVAGVEDALCALSRDAELLGYAYTDGSGYALIQLDRPITDPTPLDLVVTAYNKTTYTAEIIPDIGSTVGDVNRDGTIDIGDAVFVLNYLFKSGPAPIPLEVADCNCDQIVDLGDAVYLLNYLFRGGPPPCTVVGVMLGYFGCKQPAKVSLPDSTPPNQDCIQYQYDGAGILLLKHVNAGFNCCPDEILGDVTITGNHITLTETESLEPSGGCFCLCLFDVDYQISDLPPGEYTITVNQLYLQPGTQTLEFTVDLVSSPSGSYCVQRDDYPWGIP
jgi:hypothetical protein